MKTLALHRGDPGTFIASGDVATHLVIGAGAALMVLGALHEGASAPVRALSHRFAVRFGVISYGVYLWHDPIANRLARAGFYPPVTVLVNTLTFSVLLAAASWVLVERPTLALTRRAKPRDAAQRPPVAVLET